MSFLSIMIMNKNPFVKCFVIQQSQNSRTGLRYGFISFLSRSLSTSSVDNDNFISVIRDLKNNNSPKKLIKVAQQWSSEGRLNQNMTLNVFRAVSRMNRTDLCEEIVPLWLKATDTEPIDLKSGKTFLKSLCRLQRTDLAELVVEKTGLSPKSFLSDYHVSESLLPAAEALLPELAFGYTSVNKFQWALSTLQVMAKHSIQIDVETSKNIFKSFVRECDGESIRSALRYLLYCNGLSDNDSIQLLSNAYMKAIDFKYGVVSMANMPPDTNLEAAFIGRSNVGKSSLINMVANRKSLAFTSKTPGKTSEYNFFCASGRSRASKDSSDIGEFFLVDMPGVGYAEVSKVQRSGWLELLRAYVKERRSLKVLFHLVDSRHGLLEADVQCLELLQDLPDNVQYVLVLTKADKRGGGGSAMMVQKLRQELLSRTSKPVPIILTSSENRTGGCAMWSVLLDCLAGRTPDSFECLLPTHEVASKTTAATTANDNQDSS